MAADYSFEVKNIDIWVPAFFKHNNSFIATVDCLHPQFKRFWNLSIWNVLRSLWSWKAFHSCWVHFTEILFKFKVFMNLLDSIAPVLLFGFYWYISLPSHRPFCKWAPIYYVTIFCSPLDSVKIDFPQHPFFSTILYRVPPQLNLFLGVDTGGEAVSLICWKGWLCFSRPNHQGVQSKALLIRHQFHWSLGEIGALHR